LLLSVLVYGLMLIWQTASYRPHRNYTSPPTAGAHSGT